MEEGAFLGVLGQFEGALEGDDRVAAAAHAAQELGAAGMVPAVVLPYRSMFIITLSSEMPTRLAVASMILLLAWCGTSH